MSSIYTSAEPLIALLSDEDHEIRQEALNLVLSHVHEFWSQLAPRVKTIEAMTTDDAIGKTAALVVAKIHYHVGNQNEALKFALQSQYLTNQLLQGDIDKIDEATDPQVKILDEQFQQAMVARAIDLYITSQRAEYLEKLNNNDENSDVPSSPKPQTEISPQIPLLLKLMIDRSLTFGEFTCALGLAIDTLRLDWLRHILVTVSAKNAAALMKETFKIAVEIVDIHPFRQELLKTLTDLYLTAPTPDAQAAGGLTPLQISPAPSTITLKDEMNEDKKKECLDDNEDETLRPSHATSLSVVSDILALCQCLQALDDSEQASDILLKLVSSSNPTDHLLAYQVAYDLTQTQQIAFTSQVAAHITATTENGSTTSAAVVRTAIITPATQPSTVPAASTQRPGLGGMAGLYGLPPAQAKTTKGSSTSTLPNVQPSDLEFADAQPSTETQSDDVTLKAAKTNLCNILTGVSTTLLQNHFLYKHTQPIDTWFSTLTRFYDFGNDNTIASQLYAGYAIANAGTNRDECIRGSWSTFSALAEWSDFTARAALGNIYRGQYDAIKVILQPFLPDPRKAAVENAGIDYGEYAQGGSLYAIGLAACGVTNHHTGYLSQVLEHATVTKDQPVQAGAALALGLCSFGSGDLDLFSLLRPISWSSQPIAGLCAGVSTGLIYCGLAHLPDVQDIINETLPIARSNDHPSIQFGLGLGLALIYFNAQQGAETILSELRNPPLATQYTRWLSCWIDAMAYCGTGNIKVVNRLLNLAITDPDNDVKRTAILSLAFVLLNEPMQCISILEPLATSYNEHIRYAVAMAVGIVTSSSSIGNTISALQSDYSNVVLQALAILQPLLKDKNDVVRQGAMIGYCLALQQTTSQPKYQEAITLIEECFSEKRTHAAARVSVVHRVGAALGAGILHSSGMNASVRLISPLGNQKRSIAIAGMMLFCNYWTWFPLVNMFALALSPTAVIGTYFAPGVATAGAATAQPATITTQQAAQQQTSLPVSNIRVAPNLKFVIKMPKLAIQYPKKEVDETKATLKKVIVNTLSTAKRAKLAEKANQSNNSSGTGLARTPSLRSLGSDLTRSFSKKSTSKNPTKDDSMTDASDANKADEKATTTASEKLTAVNNAMLVRGAPISAAAATTTTTTATTTTATTKDDRRDSTSSLDRPSLSLTASQISLNAERKRRAREDKLPISVIPNCSRVLPRHIAKVFCPTGQQYQPIKKRNFGILVTKKMFDLPDPSIAELDAEKAAILKLATGQTDDKSQENKEKSEEDQLYTPPQITPGGDIGQNEPSVPQPFTMNDD